MEPEVETRFGRIRGREVAGIQVFRGVCFARPPLGPLRFQPPAPPEPWTGTQEALRSGPAAPQYALPWFGWLSAAGVSPGEDCLSLDIPFIFGSTRHPLALPLTGITASAQRLSRRMQLAWIGFARAGDPGHERLAPWPAYEPRRRPTMGLGRSCSLEYAPLEAERRLLEDGAEESAAGS